jgi:hypothetical protein
MSSTKRSASALADDLIWGVAGKNGIAAELGIPESKAYYLISQGKIPIRKWGHRTIIASRKQLQRLSSEGT